MHFIQHMLHTINMMKHTVHVKQAQLTITVMIMKVYTCIQAWNYQKWTAGETFHILTSVYPCILLSGLKHILHT